MEGYNKCVVCSNLIFYSNGSEKRKKFCSNKCRIYFNNRHIKGRTNYCLDCGSIINLRAKYCKKCSYKYRDFNREKNPRWNGGTSESYQIKIYTSILKAAGLDLNICQSCSVKRENTKRMCVHHKDGNHRNNILSNLMVLCSDCHMKLHNDKKVTVKCSFCGKEKRVCKYDSNKKKNHYCNRVCLVEHKKITMLGNTLKTDYLKNHI